MAQNNTTSSMTLDAFEAELFAAGFRFSRANARQRFYIHPRGFSFTIGADEGVRRLSASNVQHYRQQLRAVMRGLGEEPQPSAPCKMCGHCRVEKPLSAFRSSARYSQGVYYICRECERAYQTALRQSAQDAQEPPTAADVAALALSAPTSTDVAAALAETEEALASEPNPQATPPPMALLAAEKAENAPQSTCVVVDTLADFLTLSECPSAFVSEFLCVVTAPAPNGAGAVHYVLTPDSAGPREIVPAELVGYISGLLAHTSPDKLAGRIYY